MPIEMELDRVEVDAKTGEMFIRYAKVFKEGGVEVARGGLHREKIRPVDDVSGKDALIQTMAAQVRTPERLVAFRAKQARSRR